ncbi:CASC1 protein, partial [Sylvia atricapilla]|nr:CASC1 protein [Sylvia atricapilla]
WEHYLSCDGTPDPTVPQEINTFMSLWRDDHDEDIQLVMEKEEVVLNLIEKFEYLLLETSPDEITEKQRDQYLGFILQLQDLLHQKYNEATQNLLKVTSVYEDSETGNMHTVIKDKNSTFCIWVNLKKKARLRNFVFQGAGHAFDLPKSLALSSVAIRVLHTRYDHLSPLVASLKEKSSNTDDVKETEEKTEQNSDTLDVPSQGMGLVFTCSTKKILRLKDALLREEAGGREEAPRVADLQQLLPLGGVYHIDALQLPPQVQDVGDWSMVELLDVGLELYPYSPEEAEDGTQAAVQITLRLPDNVIYFQVPVVARWDPAGQQWRTDGITNITHEAEEKSITFGMCAFYTVAFLQDAHLNLPYQAWELHPTGVDEGLFTITAVFATIQIQIKDNQCMLSAVVVKEEEVLSHITGKWMSPFALRAALKRAGVNIFPAEYSPKYVPVPRKVTLTLPQLDRNNLLTHGGLSRCLSSVSQTAQTLAKENRADNEHLTAGAAKDNDWSLYMFTGEKVQNLKLTETSEAFSEELKEESEFHSTLYHMLKDSASSEAMDKVGRAGFLFIDSVYQLLLATRVLAYS